METPINTVELARLSEKSRDGIFYRAIIEYAEIHEHHREEKQQTLFRASGIARELAGRVTADAACSVCYGSLIHALQRLKESGKDIPEGIRIGQGFRGKSGAGIGIGSCTALFPVHLDGCPPNGKAMADFLSRMP